MRHALSLTLALGGAAMIAAACSGGGGGSASTGLPPGTPPTHNTPNIVSMTIKIPNAPTAAASLRKPTYVSSGTQSIGVVVTDQGASPSPAQYTNVSTCPQVSGVTTCTVNVQALPGSDTFALTAYGGTNGTGSTLSTGSITSTIVEAQANVTLPVTLGGVIASISIAPGISTLPLGESTTLNVVAKDASGAAIVGTYDNPIVLSAPNLALSSTSVTNSNDASKITAAWNYGFSGSSTSAVTASADGVRGSVSIASGTGFAYYQAGTNPATDISGFKMIAGSDGKLYFTSNGPLVCQSNNLCTATTGAVHQFDPATGTDTEVALQSEGVGLKFTSDGALWIAGGPAPVSGTDPLIYRMAPGSFSAASLTTIAVPTAAPRGYTVRSFAQDGSGNLWFQDGGGRRILKIPVAGPYASSSINAYALPNGPTGTTPGYYGTARNVVYVGGKLIVPDNSNGVVDVVDTTTGSVTGQYVTNLQASFANPTFDVSNPYDATDDGSSAYISQLGNWNSAQPVGDVEKFSPATNTFTTLPIVDGPVAVAPGASSISGSNLYFQDLFNAALHLFDLTANKGRMIPIAAMNTLSFTFPDGVATLADGTAWFSCYGSAQVFQPLCVGHTVYLSGWSVFPSSSIAVNGAGAQGGQIMGIMEAPSSDSSPFTETSSNTAVCSIANASDHNFTIIGQTAGACTVTVKDKNNVTSTINVTVTTTTGTVQDKKLGGLQ